MIVWIVTKNIKILKDITVHTFPISCDLSLSNLSDDVFLYMLPRDKIQVIILFLEFIKPTYHKENYETWNYEEEKMINYDYEKRCFNSITNALIFWNKKLKNS